MKPNATNSELLIQSSTDLLFDKIVKLIENTRKKVSVFLNQETTLMYWTIGNFIVVEFKEKDKIVYGKQILATLSQQLTVKFGKGYSYSAITRMVKVAECFEKTKIATLSQQLSWSHLIESLLIFYRFFFFFLKNLFKT